MQTQIGLESLVQRGKSPLYTQLVSVYQETQNALRDHPNHSSDDVWITLKKLKFAERITTIFNKEMGPVFKPTKIEVNDSLNMWCSITLSQNFHTRTKGKDVTPGMMMEEINRVYDDHTAKLQLSPSDKLSYGFVIGINTGMWLIRNPDGSFYLTAEELAAVTIHEIGHADQIIREGVRVYQQTIDASDIVTYVSTTPDRDVVLKLIATLRKSRYLDKSWLKVLDTAETYFKTNNALDDPSYYEALNAVALAVIKDVSSRNLLVFDSNAMGINRTKVTTRLQGRLDMERSADEFSARNGSYAALTSALRKMHDADDVAYDLVARRSMPAALAITARLLRQAAVLLIPMQDINMGYDSLLRRMKMVVETAKHAFHDDDLPQDVKQEIMQQIQEAETCIKEYEAHPYTKTRFMIKTWLDNVGKFGRVLKSPIQNRLSGDYEKLQDANRSLSRHPLYYLAKR